MKLSDLYKQESVSDERKFEVIRSDLTPSGHYITLADPASEQAAKAAYMFDAAIRRKLKKYEDENKALHDECKEAGDFTEYNAGFDFQVMALRDAFCHEIVEGWDFDDEFTQENLQAALQGFRAPHIICLQSQIISSFRDLSAKHAKK